MIILIFYAGNSVYKQKFNDCFRYIVIDPRKASKLSNLIRVPQLVVWLFKLNSDPNIDFTTLSIEYIDGNYNNCSVDNLRIVKNPPKTPNYRYVIPKDGNTYEVYTRQNLAAFIQKPLVWLDENTNTGKYVSVNGVESLIVDDVFSAWKLTGGFSG